MQTGSDPFQLTTFPGFMFLWRYCGGNTNHTHIKNTKTNLLKGPKPLSVNGRHVLLVAQAAFIWEKEFASVYSKQLKMPV